MGNFCTHLSRPHRNSHRKPYVLCLLQQRRRHKRSNFLKVALLLPKDQTDDPHSLLVPELQVLQDHLQRFLRTVVFDGQVW